MKSKFDKAAKNYEKAFTYLEYPFYRDLNNAINCELLSTCDKENLKRYIWFNTNKTGDKNAVYNDTSLNKLAFWPEIKFMIDTMKPGVDTALLRYFDEIQENDQNYRAQCRSRYYGQTYNELTIDSINIIDSINNLKILKLIDKYGYLTEELIGTKWGVISLLLLHNKHRPEVFVALFDAVNLGKINAVNYSFNLASAYFPIDDKYGIGHCYLNVLHKFPVILFSLSDKEKNLIDKYRLKLYLVTMKKQIDKTVWNCYNSRSFYKNAFATCSFSDDSFYYNMLLSKTLNGKSVEVYYKDQKEKKKTMQDLKVWIKDGKGTNPSIAKTIQKRDEMIKRQKDARKN
jgi:hypothetical protein